MHSRRFGLASEVIRILNHETHETHERDGGARERLFKLRQIPALFRDLTTGRPSQGKTARRNREKPKFRDPQAGQFALNHYRLQRPERRDLPMWLGRRQH